MKRMNEVFELPVNHEVFAVDGHTAKNGEGLTARLEADLYAAHAINHADALADALEFLLSLPRGSSGRIIIENSEETAARSALNAYRGEK